MYKKILIAGLALTIGAFSANAEVYLVGKTVDGNITKTLNEAGINPLPIATKTSISRIKSIPENSVVITPIYLGKQKAVTVETINPAKVIFTGSVKNAIPYVKGWVELEVIKVLASGLAVAKKEESLILDREKHDIGVVFRQGEDIIVEGENIGSVAMEVAPAVVKLVSKKHIVVSTVEKSSGKKPEEVKTGDTVKIFLR